MRRSGVPIAMTCAFALALLLNAGPAYLPDPLLFAVDHADDRGQRLMALDPESGPRSSERAARPNRTSAHSLAHQRNARPSDLDPDQSVEPRPDDDHFPGATLQDVPQQLDDAVSVDGGGAWARLRHVTIPLITPAILFNLVIGLVAAVQTFTQAYVMTDGGPNNASLFLVFYIYREGFRNSNSGYASALSWGLFAIIAVLSAIVFTSAKRWVHYEGGER
jgi:hypothetical protein